VQFILAIFGNRWLPQTTGTDSGDLLPPPPSPRRPALEIYTAGVVLILILSVLIYSGLTV
jgi:hypothetical protein